MSERHYLYQLLDYLNLTVNSFEKEVPLGQGTISKIVNDDKKERALSGNSIRKILDKYPNVNPLWLQTGNGDMLLEEVQDSISNKPRVGLLSKIMAMFNMIPEELKTPESHKLLNEIITAQEEEKAEKELYLKQLLQEKTKK